NCGDTITWTWNGGTDSTRSTTIPSCATPWSSPIDATTHTYSLTLACGGTYNFSCYVLNGTTKTYTAVINVSCGTTAIPNKQTQTPQVSIYPNPAQNNFTVQATDANNPTVQVFDLTGKLVLSQSINGTTNIEANLPEGVYILTLTNNQSITNKRLIIVK